MDWDTRPNRLSRLLTDRRQAGKPVLDLTESNPTRAGLPYDRGTILEPLADPAGLEYDPQPAGLASAREAVAGYYASRGLPVDPACLVLTASTSEAYSYAFRLLTDPGDDVLAPAPSYPLFEFLARMDGIGLRHYFLHYDSGWWLDTASVRAALTPRTRAILAVHPNNPTGSFLKRGELAELASICGQHGIPLIVDEVFADYRFRRDPDFVGSLVAQEAVPAIVVSGLSKVTGLPQMKLGWMVVSGPAEWRDTALSRLEIIADTYLSVSAPVQLAAGQWLERRGAFQSALRDRLAGNLSRLRTAFEDSACRVLDVEGGWYAILRLPGTRSEEEWVLAFLDDAGVLTQPGYFFDFPGDAYAVLSLMTPEAVFTEGIARIAEYLER